MDGVGAAARQPERKEQEPKPDLISAADPKQDALKPDEHVYLDDATSSTFDENQLEEECGESEDPVRDSPVSCSSLSSSAV